jgi:hypothetical protein
LIGAQREDTVLRGLALLFLVIWLVSFVVYHVAFAAVHLLLVLALLLFVLHFFRGRGATV